MIPKPKEALKKVTKKETINGAEVEFEVLEWEGVDAQRRSDLSAVQNSKTLALASVERQSVLRVDARVRVCGVAEAVLSAVKYAAELPESAKLALRLLKRACEVC